MRLGDSRRLRGPNLQSREPLGIAEVFLDEGETHAQVEEAFAAALGEVSDAAGLSGLELVVRRFPGGLVFGLAAPIDLLLVAADVVEWCALEAADRLARRESREAVTEARARFQRSVREDEHLELRALEAEARRRGVPFVWDDEEVTLGLGARGKTYAMRSLPDAASFDWSSVGRIPVAMITGTNGKTTTCRLVARMAKLAGHVVGHTSSDGVVVDDAWVERGDWTGSEAARLVLRRPDVTFAVLETARGGVLRRGLALARCDAALITNVTDDHLGEFGVMDVATLAATKAVVGQAVREGGVVVLPADDAQLTPRAETFAARRVLFAPSAEVPAMAAHLAKGGEGYVVEGGAIVRIVGTHRDLLLPVADVPITFGGAAPHNVRNALGAAALGLSLGLPREAVVEALRTFGLQPTDNPGRGESLVLANGVRVLLDFGHNPAGLEELYALARSLAPPPARITAVVTQGGDRSDEDLRALAATAARGGATRAVVWESEPLLRGREAGVIAAELRRGFERAGVRPDDVQHADGAAAAVAKALACAADGDLVVIAPFVEREAVRRALADA